MAAAAAAAAPQRCCFRRRIMAVGMDALKKTEPSATATPPASRMPSRPCAAAGKRRRRRWRKAGRGATGSPAVQAGLLPKSRPGQAYRHERDFHYISNLRSQLVRLHASGCTQRKQKRWFAKFVDGPPPPGGRSLRPPCVHALHVEQSTARIRSPHCEILQRGLAPPLALR